MLVSLRVGNVFIRPRVSVLFCETKVNDVDKARVLACSYDKIGRFDVAMDKSAGVNVLDARDLQTRETVSDIVPRVV